MVSEPIPIICKLALTFNNEKAKAIKVLARLPKKKKYSSG